MVRGRSPVLWTVPVYVKWDNEEADVYHAVPLLSKQQTALEEMLRTVGRPYNGMHRLTRTALASIAEKVEPFDPERFLSWERPRMAQAPEFHPEKRLERDEFLDALYQQGVGGSRDEVEFWWNTFCTHALDWMMNKEKPVDMYFVKLTNSPYRMNWKNALLSRHPKLGRALAYCRDGKAEVILHESGFYDDAVSLDLLAMNPKSGYCYRHVEVEHQRLWWRTVKAVELKRLQTLGPGGYAQHFMDSIRRRLKSSVRIYRQWLANIARPCATDVESGLVGEFRFAPHRKAANLLPKALRTWLVPVIVPNKLPRFKPASSIEEISGEDGPLPDLRPVQSHAPDVRDGGEILP